MRLAEVDRARRVEPGQLGVRQLDRQGAQVVLQLGEGGPSTAVPPPPAGRPPGAAPSLARLVDDLSPLPAVLLDHRYDVLAQNREMAGLLPGFEAAPPARVNAMRLRLLHPQMRGFYADREQALRDGVAHLRAAWAAHPQDRELTGLIAEFAAQDEDLARLWAEREVSVNGRGRKVLRHPVAGAITVDFEILLPLQDPELRLLVYRPADEESRACLERLCAQ